MREIYLWTEWFTELTKKIAADDGRNFLMERAGRVENLRYGDLNVDPFSFVYSLANQGSDPERRRQVYPSVHRAFGMEKPIPVDCDDAFIFPPYTFADTVEIFSSRLGDDSELLWHLFRAVVHESEEMAQYFDDTLAIDGVTTEKLTQALFLINPSVFLPYDDVTRFLGIHDLQEVVNWTQYQKELQRFRNGFPGCAFHEINLFAYLWKRGNIRKEETSIQYFHVSTKAWGNRGPDFWSGTDSQHEQRYFEPHNWVFTGGPGQREMGWHQYDERRDGLPLYPLLEPRPGDIVLIRTGRLRGRGIGIVYKNDYQSRLDGNSRLHVVWVIRRDEKLSGSTEIVGFNYARSGSGTLNAFRQTSANAETFALLTRLSRREELMASQKASKNPDAEHPRNQILYGPPGTGKTYHTVDRALAIINRVSVEKVERDIERFGELRDSGQVAMVTFHQNYAYEDFIEGIRPVLSDRAEGQLAYKLHDGIFKQIARAADAEKEGDQRFVLIIDEINRGNIAKIFGELITLIEDSRRIGQKDATKVKLPYSNKPFGVPDNLYIIGTMNTADRSIQLLDTALRRRFAFVEMMPEPEHERISMDVNGVNCREILKSMNERITAWLDREHQIGHTYLMDVSTMEDLSDVFQNKIFPLLQEYFFDDWSKIRAVLGGNDFVSERDAPRLPADLEQGEGRKIYERLASDDEQERWKDPKQYQQIYTGNN